MCEMFSPVVKSEHRRDLPLTLTKGDQLLLLPASLAAVQGGLGVNVH